MKIRSTRENKYTKVPVESEAHTLRQISATHRPTTTLALCMTMGRRDRMGLRGEKKELFLELQCCFGIADSPLLDLKTHL